MDCHENRTDSIWNNLSPIRRLSSICQFKLRKVVFSPVPFFLVKKKPSRRIVNVVKRGEIWHSHTGSFPLFFAVCTPACGIRLRWGGWVFHSVWLALLRAESLSLSKGKRKRRNVNQIKASDEETDCHRGAGRQVLPSVYFNAVLFSTVGTEREGERGSEIGIDI